MNVGAGRDPEPGWVLVTGAGRGIGQAVALRLAQLGHSLVLWARSADELRKTRAELAAEGAEVRSATVDVADPAQVDEAAAETLADLAALRAMVVNAGGGEWNPIDSTPVDEWRSVLGANLDGAFHTLRVGVPLLRRHPHAQLIGMASDSSQYSFAGRGAYCASKAGMLSLLETARRELRADGVRVTALLPSRVDSYFRGKRPGARPEALSLAEMAEVVGTLFTLPPRVEIREVHLSALTTPYGPYPEVARRDGSDA